MYSFISISNKSCSSVEIPHTYSYNSFPLPLHNKNAYGSKALVSKKWFTEIQVFNTTTKMLLILGSLTRTPT
jgi:hypothetical protein